MASRASGGSAKSNVEQIKVEPDFYFPAVGGPGEGNDGDNHDDDDGEEEEEQIEQKTHTGERPFGCEICSFHFAQSCNLQSHYRRVHGVDPKANPRLFRELCQQQQQQQQQPLPKLAKMASHPPAATSSSWPPGTMPKLIPKPGGVQPFLCCVCDEPFFDRDLLLIHEETHVPEAPFECRYCTTVYSALLQFRSHVNLHRVNLTRGGYKTKVWQQQAASGPLAVRKPAAVEPTTTSNVVLNANQPFVPSNDAEKPYQCVECKKNFQKHELYFHMKLHLKQKNIFSKKSLKCDKCGKVFEKELTLRKHVAMVHPPVVSSASGENSFLLEALKTDARSLSPEATKSGKIPSDIVIKQEPESGLGDDEVNSTVSDNPILTQLLNSNSQPPPLPASSSGPSSNGGSRNGTPVLGENEASNEGGFVISAVATVDQSFLEQLDAMERNQGQAQPMPALRRMPVLEESLRRPPVTAQSNDAPASPPPSLPAAIPSYTGLYSCCYCGKTFNEHFGFRQHMRAMHYSEKRHKCRECGKKFSLGITLATHLRTHTTVQPFTCVICYKTFTRSAALNGHLSYHGNNRVKCAECGEIQGNAYAYMKHIEKFHPDFLANVPSYRSRAEAMQRRRREIILEITRGLAKHRSEIPNVLARLRGEEPLPQNEVSSSAADSGQSEVVSSASEMETLPALRAELRKRPLRNNTCSSELEELGLPQRKSARTSAGASSPNLKRLLEQNSPTSSSSPQLQIEVKSEPLE